MLGRFNSLHRFKFVCCYSALKLERKLSLSSFDVMKYSFISFVVTKVLPETPSKCCFLVDPFVSSFNVPPFFCICALTIFSQNQQERNSCNPRRFSGLLHTSSNGLLFQPEYIAFLFVPLSQRSFFMLFFFFQVHHQHVFG